MSHKKKSKKDLLEQAPQIIDFAKELQENFSEAFGALILKLAHEICEYGLTEEEACILHGFDYTSFLEIKNRYPVIKQAFARKEVEFKRGLMKPVIKQAKENDRVAAWLLETRFPSQFSKKRKTEDVSKDMLADAIKSVQQSNNSLVVKREGKPTDVEEDARITIQDILNNSAIKLE